MILWKRVTVGELGVIVTMVVGLLLFLVKVGEWKSTVERAVVSTRQLSVQIKHLDDKIDDVSTQEEQNMGTLNDRLIRVETKLSKGLGLPPYGPYNPPPIVKYRKKAEADKRE